MIGEWHLSAYYVGISAQVGQSQSAKRWSITGTMACRQEIVFDLPINALVGKSLDIRYYQAFTLGLFTVKA